MSKFVAKVKAGLAKMPIEASIPLFGILGILVIFLAPKSLLEIPEVELRSAWLSLSYFFWGMIGVVIWAKE